MTPEEKEKIDYEIQAKRNAFNEELKEWTQAAWLVIFIFIGFCLLIKCI